VRDPGNAGTVLRSADAAGADGVVFTASSVDVYNPKTVRASAGSVFHLPLVRGVETVDAVAGLKGRGCQVYAMASDGEGATHLITCTVSGAPDAAMAETLSKSVISSTLTKAAIFGADANWGRVLCAMGYSGVAFDPDAVSVAFKSTAGTIDVCKNGRGLPFDEPLAKKILNEHDITIAINIGSGAGECTCWGCDITYDYIKINGDYRT
jgi:hypothetical protein